MASFLISKQVSVEYTSPAKRKLYTSPWWKVSEKDKADFIQVTAANYNNAVVLGRPLLMVKHDGLDMLYCGFYLVMPCHQPGRITVDGGAFGKFDYDIYKSPTTLEAHRELRKQTIDPYIDRNELYINMKLPLLTFTR